MKLIIRRTRKDDWDTSKAGAESVKYRAGSQKARLMDVYREAYPSGLTDEEAAEKADLLNSCYWKRCGELREEGCIAVLTNNGEQVVRTGSAGVPRIVCVAK